MNPFDYQTYVTFDPFEDAAADNFSGCKLPKEEKKQMVRKLADFVKLSAEDVEDPVSHKNTFTSFDFPDSLTEDCEVPEELKDEDGEEGLDSGFGFGFGGDPHGGQPVVHLPVEFDIVDTTFQVPIPYAGGNITGKAIPGMLYAQEEAAYNFYIPRYEGRTSFTSFPENLLPHLYTFRILIESDLENEVLQQHVNLGGIIEESGYYFDDPKQLDKGSAEGHLKSFDLLNSPLGQYYDLYAGQMDEILKCEVGQEIKTRYENLIFSQHDAVKWLDRSAQRFKHPMYLGVEFNTTPAEQLAIVLENVGMFDILLADMAHYISEGINIPHAVDSIVNGGAGAQTQTLGLPGLGINSPLDPIVDSPDGPLAPLSPPPSPDTPTKKWSINDWLDVHIANTEESIERDNVVFMSTKYRDNTGYYDKQLKVPLAQMLEIVVDTIEFLKGRSLLEVLDEVPSYSEILFYRIAKYKGTDISGDPVQNTFIPNLKDLKKVSFFDTQVAWGQEYTYVVYAYNLVLESDVHVKYSLDQLTGEILDVLPGSGVEETKAVIIETPYFVNNGVVMDAPPPAPNVSLWPYQNNDSEFLIMANGGIGTFRAPPVPLLEDDVGKYKNILKWQKSKDGLIEYSADDPPSQFQLFITDIAPASPVDLVKTATLITAKIQTDKDGVPIVSNHSFLQKIEPNRKYYIMLRSLDVHLHPSPPSEIFEVEIVKDGGTSYFGATVYETGAMGDALFTKSATKRLKLALSDMQHQINKDQSAATDVPPSESDKSEGEVTLIGAPGDQFDQDKWIFDLANPKIALGPEKDVDSAYGQKYKMRLRSKETGKVMDINFIFNHKHEKDYDFLSG